ncbi:hypothetical protein THAOC_01515, partial [Thalassiosira oceanica]
MNGEDLVYDYQFHVVDEPSEWAFNWEYTECGTPTPTPRENRATMWMVQNVSDPVWNVERLFKKLGTGCAAAAAAAAARAAARQPGSRLRLEQRTGSRSKRGPSVCRPLGFVCVGISSISAKMNGEDLVYDYQFHVVDEPSEWAFNWEYTECGTPTPTPRENRATMWMVQNVSDPVWNVERLFKKLG